MTTRRAKKHKERTHYVRLVREHLNEVNRGGLFDKRLNKHQRNPHKFRRRAYYREKGLEDESLKKKAQQPLKAEPLGLLQFVKAPFDPDPFEPFWTTKEDDHD